MKTRTLSLYRSHKIRILPASGMVPLSQVKEWERWVHSPLALVQRTKDTEEFDVLTLTSSWRREHPVWQTERVPCLQLWLVGGARS